MYKHTHTQKKINITHPCSSAVGLALETRQSLLALLATGLALGILGL